MKKQVLCCLFIVTSAFCAHSFAANSATPTRNDSEEVIVDQLCDDFYVYVLEKQSYEDAKKTAETLLRLGEDNRDKELRVRGLVRLAYVELFFGKWRNKWAEKIELCEKLLGDNISINHIAQAEFLMFTGHMQGKWQDDAESGFKKIERSIWMASELGEDKLLVQATIRGAEVLSFSGKKHRMLEYSYRAKKIADQIGHRSTSTAALYRLVFSEFLVDHDAASNLDNARELSKVWPENEIALWSLCLLGDSVRFQERSLATIKYLKKKPATPRTAANIGEVYLRLGMVAETLNQRQLASENYLAAASQFKIAKSKNAEAESFLSGSLLGIESDVNNVDDVDALVNSTTGIKLIDNEENLMAATAAAYHRVGAADKAMAYSKKLSGFYQDKTRALRQQTKSAADDYWNAQLSSRKQKALIEKQNRKSEVQFRTFAILGAICAMFIVIAITRYRAERNQKANLEVLVEERTKALNAASLQARAADQAKSEFLARVNHEIRNPLTAILGYCDLLQANPDGSANFIAGLRISSDHLLELVDGVIELSQIEQGELTTQLTEFGLREKVCEIAQVIRDNANKKGLEFGFDIDSDQTIIGDETKLRQIILNLASNAIKFTESGSVNLSVKANPVSADQLNVVINVSDSGCGITEHEQKSVFGKFARASSNMSEVGNGLGLHITQKFVEYLGGTILLESQVGIGTRVEVNLPFAIGKAQPRSNVIDNENPSENFRVLVVDDQESIRTTLCMQLSFIGYANKSCETLEETLDLIEEWQPHIVLLDLRMSQKNGFEVLDEIRSLMCLQPVVAAMTGDATERVKQKCYEAGFDHFITKPFKMEIVKSLMNELKSPDSKTGSRSQDI